MGQRSQIFIRTYNPLVSELKLKQSEKDIEAFGTDEYTVLAFHHSWLYGLTFAAVVNQVLSFYGVKDNQYATHPRNHNIFMDGITDFVTRRSVDWTRPFVDFHTYLLSLYMRAWDYTRGIGFERFLFLNHNEPEMREQFDQGDNNDGICIIDPLNGKYAFMLIHERIDSRLKLYTPYTAQQYVASYYSRNDKVNAKINRGIISKTKSEYKPYTLLTVDEIIEIFPKMAAEMNKARVKNKP